MVYTIQYVLNRLFYCSRFVILKLVPRDHVDQLPVPKRIMDYLKTPNYYSENIEDPEEENQVNQIGNVQPTNNGQEQEAELVPENVYSTQDNIVMATSASANDDHSN